MKIDQYLNLCLKQAAQSPLHFRHGCIAVKGGKVIGKGYNDYRPGYDGRGALPTGNHHRANTCLTMHAEMMAINSAFGALSKLGGIVP